MAFRRGHRISAGLASEWLRDGAYTNARVALDQALAQEQILDGVEAPAGLQVMNIHKAKGKQFDEVIIFEGWPKRVKREIVANPDRIVRFNSREQINDQARQNFRVSVTRGKRQTTILTPIGDPCVLLLGEGD